MEALLLLATLSLLLLGNTVYGLGYIVIIDDGAGGGGDFEEDDEDDGNDDDNRHYCLKVVVFEASG